MKLPATFLLSTFLPPGAPGSTGGTTSNYHLVRAVAEVMPTRVLAFRTADSAGAAAGSTKASVETLPKPTFPRGTSIFLWQRHLAKLASKRLDTAAITFLSSNTIQLAPRLKRIGHRVVLLTRAYEDFGFGIPGGSPAQRLRGLRQTTARGFGADRAYRAADLCITNSEYMARAVAHRFSKTRHIEVLYPPLDLPRGSTVSARPGSVGFVNRSTAKGGAFVIELARRMPQRTFLIFGSELQGELPDNLHNMGWEGDRQRLFGSAATWIVPSLWNEPFGRVAVEALACGRAVCVANRGGLPEAVGEYGEVVESLAVEDWAAAIERASPPGPAVHEHLDRFSISLHDETVRKLVERLQRPQDQGFSAT